MNKNKALKLGIVYGDNNKAESHRTVLKILLNPFLRLFGFQLTSIYNTNENRLEKTNVFVKCEKQLNLIKNLRSSWLYE